MKRQAAHAPTVTIITPYDGYTLSVPDTLVVTADVSGDNTVDRATVVVAMIAILLMVTYIGEAIREAFDPKRFTYYE